MTSLLFIALSIFLGLSPIFFAVGWKLGVWNFPNDIFVLIALCALTFFVVLSHVFLQLYSVKRQEIDEDHIRQIVRRFLNERIQK